VAIFRSFINSRGKGAIVFRLLSFFVLVLFLALMSGCAAKKKEPGMAIEPEPVPKIEIDPGQQRIAAWHALMHEKRHVSDMEKLEAVNSFFNQLEFVDDRLLWGKNDYWATPQQMLIKNGGDCEDFATAKYFTLRQLKIPDNKMRLTYVKALRLKEPHMVLSYYIQPTTDPLILDSLITEILSASERKDLIPIYSFNGQGLWLAKKQDSVHLGKAERLSLWQDLQFRFIQDAIAAPPSQ
jgi:predicted transglutaminase-like cysteine proteinase